MPPFINFKAKFGWICKYRHKNWHKYIPDYVQIQIGCRQAPPCKGSEHLARLGVICFRPRASQRDEGRGSQPEIRSAWSLANLHVSNVKYRPLVEHQQLHPKILLTYIWTGTQCLALKRRQTVACCERVTEWIFSCWCIHYHPTQQHSYTLTHYNFHCQIFKCSNKQGSAVVDHLPITNYFLVG